MRISVESQDPARVEADLVALPLFQFDPARFRMTPRVAALDRALCGQIGAVIASGDFRGRKDQSLVLYGQRGQSPKRLLLLGIGEESRAEADLLRRAAAQTVAATAARRGGRAALCVPASRRLRPPAVAQALAEGAVLAGYRFDAYRTQAPANQEEPREVTQLALLFERTPDARAARAAAHLGSVVAESQNVARALSNEPGNALPPEALAREATRVAREVGLAVRVFDVAELRRRKMGGILAVGQGSANPPRLIVLELNAPPRGGRGKRKPAAARRRPTICLVGKGITFDSGGISIKPAASMDEMKHDMSGAAAVIGALRAAALLRLPLHVVGVIGAAENLPSATAYRPGDVVTTMSGRTVEVLNTDAEGRVVLADALHFAREEFSPEAIVDLATLTGACVVALGPWCSGLFGNDERLVERVRRAGENVGERVWPMPLWDAHKEAVRSTVADLKNTGGRDGGAITAAAFLASFAGDTAWAHLDIAGTAWTQKVEPAQPKGATGVGVRLLVELLRGWRR
jgi:leucyl aminopeptidase